MNFIFILLAYYIVGNDSKNIEKRNLVAKFTSNPFFLRHFGIYPNYENPHYYTDPSYEDDEILDLNSVEDLPDEEPLFISILPPDDYTEEEEEEIEDEDNNFDSDVIKTVIPEESTFHILPLFDKTDVFRIDDLNLEHNSVKKVLEVTDNSDNSSGGFIYSFRSLPHFNSFQNFKTDEVKKTNFEQTQTTVLETEKSSDYFFKNLPDFDRQVSFQKFTQEIARPIVSTTSIDGAITAVKTLSNFEDSQHEVLEAEKTANNSPQAVIYAFGSLPHFERQFAFQKFTQIIESSTVPTDGDIIAVKNLSSFEDSKKIGLEVEKTDDSSSKKFIYAFTSLPHFERQIPFQKFTQEIASPTVSTTSIDGAVTAVKTLSSFEDSQHEVLEAEKTANNSPQAVIYVFSSLPHFERQFPFQKLTQLIESSTVPTDEDIIAVNNLSSFKDSKKVGSEAEKTDDSSSKKFIYAFTSLPHFERQLPFQKFTQDIASPTVSTAVIDRAITAVKTLSSFKDSQHEVLEAEKTPDSSTQPIIYVFSSLPHFDREFSFQKLTQLIESSTVPTDGDTTAVKTLSNLKKFNETKNFDKPNNFNKPAPVVSKIKTSTSQNQNIKTLPNSQTKKVIKKLTKKTKFEFGKRLQPLVRIKTLADLPLEESSNNSNPLVDSYGKLITTKSL